MVRRRKLIPKSPKLPPYSWLYSHGATYRSMPNEHPGECSWCGTKHFVIEPRWHICPECDTGGG